jgi:hypothetical protein
MKRIPAAWHFVLEVGQEVRNEQGRHITCDGCIHARRATTQAILDGRVPCFECHTLYIFEGYRPHYEGPFELSEWQRLDEGPEAVQ